MTLQQQQVQLLDGQGHVLGGVLVREVRGQLLLGQFQQSPDFGAVASLFAEHREAVNQQLFSHVEELDEQIAALGLRLRVPGTASLPAIDNVQIGEGRITFRLCPGADDEQARNGAASADPRREASLPR